MKILLNSGLFEYDIRGLLQAFFPWEKFSMEESAEGDSLSVFFARVSDPEDTREITVEERGEFRAEITFSYEDAVYRKEISFDRSDPMAKTRVKQEIYRILSRATGRTLPWGTLTGIRPTKLVREMREQGTDRDESVLRLKNDYFVNEEKAALADSVADSEMRLLKTLRAEDGYSLYVGVPFCPSTCLYCSFSSVTIDAYRERIGEYLEAVERELKLIRELAGSRRLHSIYFGGGTPTSLSASELDSLLSMVARIFPVGESLEWTVEAGRPDSITREKLRVMKQYPVTRISVNPQTMHDRTLELIGRRHTSSDVRRAFSEAREEGIGNINMDLILGLPGETEAEIRETLDEVVAMGPQSVTLHALAIKRSSRLNLFKEIYQNYRMELPETLMSECTGLLRENGLFPYYLYRQKNMAGNLENVGFSKKGAECFYNILIMEEVEDILSAGAGAMTKRVTGTRVERAANPHDVDTYLKNLDEMLMRKRKLYEI